jgi:membrane protein required for colicin V production
MPIVDIVIAVAIVISIAVGLFRGFVKEAISIVTLLVAIWAALNFGAEAGRLGEAWFDSAGLQLWFGRALIFIAILVAGGLLGWLLSKAMRVSVLNGTDRTLGGVFGFCRGALLVGVFVIGGQLARFDSHDWWRESRLIPYGATVAEWIRVMAPRGVDLLKPGPAPAAPVEPE